MLAAQSSPVSGIVFVVAVLATSIVLVAVVAWASRQLLGLPVGTLRAFITGVLGVPLIVAMIFIVAAEVLVPSGTGPGPVEVVLGVRSAVARSRRYWQISRIAVRHGLGPYLRGGRRGEDAAGGRAALALSLRQALEEGGVTFVKLGQLLSTRPLPG